MQGGSVMIGVMGERAGGGLAAALALLVRDRGGFSLAHKLCLFMLAEVTASG